ncbi:ArsR family transcriptional regulator [Candidatus Woesearchaeota archaeon]|nr:ArsR family transcriptional regulator [Candidatus Woesearchaeota archaeon]
MEQETLFTASKWQILQLLAERSLSPIELAAESSTSVANVSQQLRLLEMAGLVKSERIPNRDRGQPRILYSLAGNHSFLISTSNDFVQKKLFKLSNYNKVILRIWFYEKPELHYYLEKAFWNIEEHLPKIDAIALDESKQEVSMVLFTRDDKLAPKAITIKGPDGTTRKVNFTTVHPDTPGKAIAKAPLFQIYDPGSIIPGMNTPSSTDGGKK